MQTDHDQNKHSNAKYLNKLQVSLSTLELSLRFDVRKLAQLDSDSTTPVI